MTIIHYAKAIAYFRGNPEVELEDLRQILPFVLFDKLVQDVDAPFFESPGNTAFRSDRVGWLRRVFDLSCAEYDRLNLDRDDPVAQLASEFRLGLDGVAESEVASRLVKIERLITDWARGNKLYGHLYDDMLKLKYLHQRYTNYLRWLKTR
nr:hypothetical protein [Verrucomicrobium spinosum]